MPRGGGVVDPGLLSTTFTVMQNLKVKTQGLAGVESQGPIIRAAYMNLHREDTRVGAATRLQYIFPRLPKDSFFSKQKVPQVMFPTGGRKRGGLE